MTFEVDIWHAGSPRHFLGQVQSSASRVRVQSHMRFSATDAED